jgi:hypothetical protein
MLGNNFKQSALSGYGIGEAILYLPEDYTKIDSFVGENALQTIEKKREIEIIYLYLVERKRAVVHPEQ